MTDRKDVLLGGASMLALLFMGADPLLAHSLPGKGQFVEGRGTISRSGGRMTVDQSGATGIVNWKTFSIGKANSVIFNNAQGATLNIVKGGNVSRISGSLQASGSIYLINRAGVLVSKSGTVDTQGSFVASGRAADSIADEKRLTLSGGNRASIINRGAIQSGKSVGLFGATVGNSGRIAGRNVAVVASGYARISGAITADRGNGRGGNVETSGGRLGLEGVNIRAARWLLDPVDLTVGANAANTISASLNAGTDVTLKTTATSASGPGTQSQGGGDIAINAAIAWNSHATLTLDAWRNVVINRTIELQDAGGLTVISNDGSGDGAFSMGPHGEVTFDNLGGALSMDGHAYMIENSVAGLANDIAADPGGYFALVQDYDASADGTYSLAPIPLFKGTFEGFGHTISNLSINNTTQGATGLFGFVHNAMLRDITLRNVSVTAGAPPITGIGSLVGQAAFRTTILNAHATGQVIGGFVPTGGLAGIATGLVENSSANVDVSGGGNSDLGGLVGQLTGEILNSHASGDVSNGFAVGGLVGNVETAGFSDISVKNSYATGNVTGADFGGGLIGTSFGGGAFAAPIVNSYATGDVEAITGGGLMGWAEGLIKRCFATGNVTAADDGPFDTVGGLVGEERGQIFDSYSTGTVRGVNGFAGGFVGELLNVKLHHDHGHGSVRATIKRSYSTGAVTGGGGTTGGFIGSEAADDRSILEDDYWDMTTSGITDPSQGVGTIVNRNGITGLTDSALKRGLPAGFSASVWAQSNSINDGLPYLIDNPPP